MGTKFWMPLTGFVAGSLLHVETIGPDDMDLVQATDDPEDAVSRNQTWTITARSR